MRQSFADFNERHRRAQSLGGIDDRLGVGVKQGILAGRAGAVVEGDIVYFWPSRDDICSVLVEDANGSVWEHAHLKWIEPRHMQHQIHRWDKSHQTEIESAFFNGSGMLIWHVDENLLYGGSSSNSHECKSVNNYLCSGSGRHFSITLDATVVQWT